MRHIIVVDCETNGLDPERHQAVEVAWWNLATDERGVFVPTHSPADILAAADIRALQVNRYIDRLPDAEQDRSGAGTDLLHRQFRTPAGKFVEQDVAHTLAGSNPRFDAGMLAKLFATTGATEDFDDEPWHHRLLDLGAYAMGVLGLDEVPGLARVCELLHVSAPDHTAEGDVTATGLCFRKLMDLSQTRSDRGAS
ncbi:hypothetical protein [Pseudonocardia sp.]|uniref:hypothetical protein n=1 Tax=Pseudonocardia sp. TaxID=60912 RepID=UPI003D0E3ADE